MADDIVKRPATKDIRFHARLMRLSDCITGDPNIDEDLWALPLAALAEIERLRQGIWDACVILGMDHDDNNTPRHVEYPHLADLIVEEAKRMRADYEEALRDELGV